MMNLSPYRRGGDIFSFMDSLERSFFNDSVSGMSQFRTDISEKDGKYMLEAELPGFDKQDISVQVDGETLTISAQHDENKDEKDDKGNYIRRERRFGSFSRSFDVSGIDIEGITANYENGVLKLQMPKAAEQKPESRQIAVGGEDSKPKMEQGQAQQKAEYSEPAQQQAEQVQKNSSPDEYASYKEGDPNKVPPQ